MASLLRSGKFFRLFSNLTRSFELNNTGRNNNESLVCARRGEWEIQIQRSLSAAQLPLKNLNDTASQQTTYSIDGIDKAFEKAELDAKKLGRISKDDVKGIIEKIKQLKTATTTQSLLLIRCCGNLVPEEPQHSRTKLVQDVWKMLESFGVPLDISHHNALLRVYLENEHSFNPMKFLETLELKNVQPNRVTYQRLLSAYCQKGNIDGASQILEIMKKKDLPIGEMVFNSLVMGHANTGDLESAKSVIKVMTQAGLEPDSETYKALLCGFAKNGMSDEFSSTLSECKSKEISLHDRDLLEVLYSAALNDHQELVDKILGETRKFSGYNQDCINIILRLINQKKEDAALKVFNSMKPALLGDRQAQASGGFFIRQLVKANCAPEKIVSVCQSLCDSGLNNRAFFRALEAANSYGRPQIANAVLKEIQKQKDTLRPQAFWPLLTSQSKSSGEKGVLETLRQMAAVQVMPNVDTINQHVLPHMVGDHDSLLRKLRSADVPPSVVAVSLMIQSLNKQDFSTAIKVASNIFLRFDSVLLQRAAADAYVKTLDASSLTKLIWSMLRQPQAGEAEYDPKDRAAEVAGPIIKEVLNRAPKPKLGALEPLLNSMHQSGLGISQNIVQLVQETLGDEMTESAAQLLVELGSGKLAPTDLIPYPSGNRNYSKRAQNFVELARSNKLEEALKEKEYLESQNFVFTDPMNILLMDLYARHERFDESLAIFKSLTSNSELTITPVKLFSLATCLLKKNREEDALKVLQHLKPLSEKADQNTMNMMEVTAWRMLNAGALSGNVELTQKLFEVLEQNKFKITGMIAGPLVRVHLTREDIDSALKAFMQCVEKYRITPLKSTLTAQLIEKEDTQRLQQVMDASIKVHGEVNSLYDLVFAFLECGRVRQAKKVLETPGLRARSQRIEMVCKRYVDEKRITELENLVKITRDVYGIDRTMMFSHLLSGYISIDDATRASGLWTQMQEEDVKPTDDFLRRLGTFLQEKNVPVPFVLPDPESSASTQIVTEQTRPTVTSVSKASVNRPSKTTQVSNATSVPKATQVTSSSEKTQFLSAIKEGNLDAALQHKKKMEANGESLTVRNKSELIEIAVKANRLGEAKELVLELVKSGGYPLPRVFRYFVKVVAAVGDHQSIREIGQYLNEDRKSTLSYENVLAAAVSHDPASAAAYVDSLLSEVKGSILAENETEREQQLKSLRTKFPRGGILAIIEKNPSILAKCQEVATEYVKLGVHAPLNSLWCHYLNNGNMTEAEKAWEILKSSPIAIGFQPVCRHLRQQEDSALAEKLITMLATSINIKPSGLGVAYSAWIDVYRSKKDLDSAIKTLNTAVAAGVELPFINYSTLSSLKSECEATGKTFPFTLPPPSEKPKAQSEEA